ncbi:MAG: ABC transporter ATP-binding protein [Flavobacteriales bacterium]|nr:ABC transporter ATP-binding protein [Flavobacteriales bacterium]
MSTVSGKAFDTQLFLRLIAYARPYKMAFRVGLAMTIFLAFLAPLRPLLIQYTVDSYIIEPNKEGLLRMTLIMVALLILESIVQLFNTYLTNWLGQSVIRDLRVQVYEHISHFKLKYFDNTAIGTLVTRAISDIETIAEVFSQGILVIIGDILQLIVVIIFMFALDWRLALISLASLPLLILTTYVFKAAIKIAFQDVRTQVARLNAFVQEHLTGMSIIQIFNREDRSLKDFGKINNEHKKAHIRTVWIFSIFFPVVEILSAISLGLLIWWGAKGVLEGLINFGHLFAFILFIFMLFRPIRQLADRFNTLQMGMVGSERVFNILDTEAKIDDSGTKSPENIKGNIRFNEVWFAYKDEDYVLKNVSFEVKEGQTLAIVGATGAGKSSIINILSRLYEINKGEISIDGINTKEFKLELLRKSIGVVLQDVFLFSDSIYNNITLNNPDISKDAVILAAKKVGIHDHIKKLPGAYQFDVKERGGMLSVGQRQLISFLRAYVHNPQILVLDEATSSVDSESEHLIQEAIKTLTENRTSIIIAHRLATIQAADSILVMDQGEIVERGTHDELLALDGQYKRLYELSQIKESV